MSEMDSVANLEFIQYQFDSIVRHVRSAQNRHEVPAKLSARLQALLQNLSPAPGDPQDFNKMLEGVKECSYQLPPPESFLIRARIESVVNFTSA